MYFLYGSSFSDVGLISWGLFAFRRAGRRPRLLSCVDLYLTPSLRFPVCLYTCVSPPKLLKPQLIHLPSGVPLLPCQRFKTETGDPLGAPVDWEDSAQEAPAGPHGFSHGDGRKLPVQGPLGGALGPEKLKKVVEHGDRAIEMDEEEVKRIKRFGPPSLRVLGFIPTSRVSYEYNVSRSIFVASASNEMIAAVRQRQIRNRHKIELLNETRDARDYFYECQRLLSTLILVLERKNLAVLVSFVPRRGSAVMLAALLPQLQEVDERGAVLQSSGLHLIRYPFKEDIRNPNIPWASVSVSPAFLSRVHETIETNTDTDTAPKQLCEYSQEPTLQERQMLSLTTQAASILKQLEIQEFDVQQLPNAHRARQIAAVEAFALRLSAPSTQPDSLQPDRNRFSSLDPLFLRWAESVRNAAPVDVGNSASSSRGKRGPPAGTSGSFSSMGVKKPAKMSECELPSEERVRSLAASGHLESLTIPQLRGVLGRWKLRVGGNKAELITRIKQYINV